MKIPNDAIVTYTGRVVRPLDPDPETIAIEDIAHALANQCRFTGHTKHFYSVAQHSVLVSEIVDWDYALWGLLHDGTEAYLSDIARPLKTANSELGNIYRYSERKLAYAIALKFDLGLAGFTRNRSGLPDSVKWADDVLLRTEMRDLMPEVIAGDAANYEGEFLDEEIRDFWMPDLAEFMFLRRFRQITAGPPIEKIPAIVRV